MNTALLERIAEKLERNEVDGNMRCWWQIPAKDSGLVMDDFGSVELTAGELMRRNAAMCLFSIGVSIAQPDFVVYGQSTSDFTPFDETFIAFTPVDVYKTAVELFDIYVSDASFVFGFYAWHFKWKKFHETNPNKAMAIVCRKLIAEGNSDFLRFPPDLNELDA